MDFNNLEKFCVFLGWERSGHNLIASIIDANVNTAISNEAQIIHRFCVMNDSCVVFPVEKQYREIFIHLLINSSTKKNNNNALSRQAGGYDYTILNRLQGENIKLKIIGDSSVVDYLCHIKNDFNLLSDFSKFIELPLIYIFVVRNPFDILATTIKKTKNILEDIFLNEHIKSSNNKLDLKKIIINIFFNNCNTINDIYNANTKNTHIIRLEQFIQEPQTHLKSLCNFLHIGYTARYIDDCCKIVYSKPNISRNDISWSRELIEKIEDEIKKYYFFNEYSFTT